jgi:single-strand DNA-binding protein
MPNEANFTVAGYVATKPYFSATRNGVSTLSMRVGWTPRRLDRATGTWEDGPTCFVSVKCYGRMAENAKASLDKGDPVVVSGTLRMHEYESKQGIPRTSVDITAAAMGHDLSRGITNYIRVRPKGERAEEGQDSPDAAGDGRDTADTMPADPQDDDRDRDFADAAPPEEDLETEAAALLAAGAQPADGGLTDAAREPVAAPF